MKGVTAEALNHRIGFNAGLGFNKLGAINNQIIIIVALFNRLDTLSAYMPQGRIVTVVFYCLDGDGCFYRKGEQK